MVKLSEDGNFLWDGKKWQPYEEPFKMNPVENEEQEEERYIPEREFSQPPDWHALEVAEYIATHEFDSSAISVKFHDPEHEQSVMTLYAFMWFFLMILTGNLLLVIGSLVIAYVTMPIFLSLRQSRFDSRREKTISQNIIPLKEFYEDEFRKQMDEANLEMAELESKAAELGSRFD